MGKTSTRSRSGDQGRGTGIGSILLAALGLLMEPYERAEERHVSVWNVAATRQALNSQGLTDDLLLRLLKEDLVDQRLDKVVLTARGAAVARGRCDPGQEQSGPHVVGGLIVPFYDEDLRTLSYEGRLVKKLRQQADVQEIVLRAFQRQGWPRALKDPLPKHPTIAQEARLHGAIRGLMNAQKEARIRFFRNGTRCTICWEPVAAAKKKRA
jgi:hypothetical protein